MHHHALRGGRALLQPAAASAWLQHAAAARRCSGSSHSLCTPFAFPLYFLCISFVFPLPCKRRPLFECAQMSQTPDFKSSFFASSKNAGFPARAACPGNRRKRGGSDPGIRGGMRVPPLRPGCSGGRVVQPRTRAGGQLRMGGRC